jgi:hypothetical protein
MFAYDKLRTMSELTKKDLEEVFDRKLDEKLPNAISDALDTRLPNAIFDALSKEMPKYQAAIIEAVDFQLQQMEQRMDEKYAKEASVVELRTTLDNFLKQMIDQKEEFILLKA